LCTLMPKLLRRIDSEKMFCRLRGVQRNEKVQMSSSVAPRQTGPEATEVYERAPEMPLMLRTP